MKISMLSTSGKLHQKCKRIKPLNKVQRQRVYGSCEINYQSKERSGQKKFSPFNTISRQSRDSYLLRVTCQPNTQTNYQLNFKPVLSQDRRSTIDKASFKRIIGPVNDRDYSVDVKSNRDHRCVAAFHESTTPKPLTARDLSRWRKTFQHFDFEKQIDPQRNNAKDYLKSVKSTHDSFQLQTLRDTTQSNFNNFKRFSLQPKKHKAHDFKSDFGHKLMSHIYQREIEPSYNTLDSNQEIIKKSMRKPRGQLRFDTFRNKIATRFDRADPDWLQTLEYETKIPDSSKDRNNATLDFQLFTNRKQNEVHSKYPIRQSLKASVPNNKIN